MLNESLASPMMYCTTKYLSALVRWQSGKVARLVDSYMAENASDLNLKPDRMRSLCSSSSRIFKNLVRWSIQNIPTQPSCLHVEVQSLKWAMESVQKLGFVDVLFETDAKKIVMAVETTEVWPSIKGFVQEIEVIRQMFDRVADSLAKKSMDYDL